MRTEAKEWALLLGKSLLVVAGGILTVAALVDLVVAGINTRALAVLALGLALSVPPLALAFRDALQAARQGRI